MNRLAPSANSDSISTPLMNRAGVHDQRRAGLPAPGFPGSGRRAGIFTSLGRGRLLHAFSFAGEHDHYVDITPRPTAQVVEHAHAVLLDTGRSRVRGRSRRMSGQTKGLQRLHIRARHARNAECRADIANQRAW